MFDTLHGFDSALGEDIAWTSQDKNGLVFTNEWWQL